MAKDIKFSIKGHVGTLSGTTKGWHKELNFVSWNEAEAKLDLREWSPEYDKMGKGLTLSEEEARQLWMILGRYFSDDHFHTEEEKTLSDSNKRWAEEVLKESTPRELACKRQELRVRAQKGQYYVYGREIDSLSDIEIVIHHSNMMNYLSDTYQL